MKGIRYTKNTGKIAESDGMNTLDAAAEKYYLQSGEEAMEELVLAGERLIRYFARLYGGGCCMEDLKQAGVEGLLKALKRYNPESGASFTTYAGHCIMGEIRHHVRQEASYYRPACLQDLRSRVDRFVEEALKETGEVPPAEKIAKSLNITGESVTEVMKAGMVSMEEVDVSRISSASYKSFQLPIEDRLLLEQSLKKLSEFQRRVIQLLFIRGMTQQQASKVLGVQQRQVSRIKQNSLEALREHMRDNAR